MEFFFVPKIIFSMYCVVFPEITWLLKTLNFKTIDIFGAKLGAFSRNDELSTEDFEMLVIAEK